jgi:hypothetical protein
LPPTQNQTDATMIVEQLERTMACPYNLAQVLYNTTQTMFTQHYWIVDNSGSMLTLDAVRVVQSNDDLLDVGSSRPPQQPLPSHAAPKMNVVTCSRWNELEHTILSHAAFAGILQTSTTFRFLNHPKHTKGMPHEFTIRTEQDYAMAKTTMSMTQPEGITPLIDHIMALYDEILAMTDDLRQKGHKVVVVIATDGLPSDEYGESSPQMQEEFANALKKLQLLPVWIVIRLCTKDRRILNFYRKLDKKLESPIECISNFLTESQEIYKYNPWLNYALPLHQCREMGFYHRVFDLLDERPLSKDDLYEFLIVLFGAPSFVGAPNIHTEFQEFIWHVRKIVTRVDQQWCPHSRKMEDWIDIKKLALEHGLRGSIRQMFIK